MHVGSWLYYWGWWWWLAQFSHQCGELWMLSSLVTLGTKKYDFYWRPTKAKPEFQTWLKPSSLQNSNPDIILRNTILSWAQTNRRARASPEDKGRHSQSFLWCHEVVLSLVCQIANKITSFVTIILLSFDNGSGSRDIRGLTLICLVVRQSWIQFPLPLLANSTMWKRIYFGIQCSPL